MNRRHFTKLLAGGAASLACGPKPAPAGATPNFVIIFADDLGYGDLGCYGHPTIRTPHLDQMAEEGMRFTQFYSAAPVCSPSRAALLTGRLPIRSGLTHVLFPYSTGGIQDGEVTLAEALKPLGYSTACAGKWHLGHLPRYLPVRHGFDSYFGIPYSNDMSKPHNPGITYDAPPTPLIRGEQTVEQEPDQRYLTRRYTEEATRFIRESAAAKKPFFLYLPHTMPHTPLFASERFRGKSARGLYGDVVEEIDWSVGEVLRAIREAGADENTVMLFSSDNGPWLVKKQDGGSAGLLREGKMSTWEGGMREPFLARWPGRIPAGSVTQAFGTLMDVFPTFVNLAGGKLPDGRVYDGADLSPVLLSGDPGREPRHFYYYGVDLCAVRRGPWKLHLMVNEPAAGNTTMKPADPPLLYNVLEDPSEKYDLAASRPEEVKALLALVDEHKRSVEPGEPQR